MINTTRLAKMIELNFTQKEIAERLGCSDRQLRRKIKELGIEKTNTIKPDRESEAVLREFYIQYESGEQASERFGISRQAILKAT